jgi:hypothetical protein
MAFLKIHLITLMIILYIVYCISAGKTFFVKLSRLFIYFYFTNTAEIVSRPNKPIKPSHQPGKLNGCKNMKNYVEDDVLL